MLAAGDRNSAVALQFRVAVHVVGNHRLFEPAQVERLQQRQHALGVVESPSHVRVGHHVDAVADRLAHGAHQFEIALHAGGAIDRSPSEAQFHGLVALVLVAFRFVGNFVQLDGCTGGWHKREFAAWCATEQPIDGLLRGFAHKVPQRNVHGADRRHADALAAERHGLAIHVLPEKFHVPRVRRRSGAA